MILKIFNKDVPLRNFLFVIGEGSLIFIAILTAAFLRLGSAHDSFLSHDTLSKILLIVIVCQVSLYFNELYNLKVTDTSLELGLRLTKSLGITSIVLALIYFCLPSLLVGHGIFFISMAILFVLITSWRYIYTWVLKKKMFTEKILILGLGNLSRAILNELSQKPDSGYEVAGVISMNSDSPSGLPREVPVFSGRVDLCKLVRSLAIGKIIVALEERRGSLPLDDLLRCKMSGIRIMEGASFYEESAGKILVENINPSWFVYSPGFNKSQVIRLAKRASDLALASLGLLLTTPLIGIIALAIKLDSRGPILFRQERCGEGGRRFILCKFRSMIANAEEACGHIWAQENDCRITKVGRILRKYRLDEIPQMWSVFKGDMSFVGPRPERPEFVQGLKEIIPYYDERHTVKPGITGWAQVCYGYGASVHDALEKLKYDLFYIKHMSILMDLMILFRTFKIVLQQSGAR